jgi:heavy metal sensor kinase
MMISIRTRLTLWYVAVLAVVLAAFSAGVVFVQGRFSRSQFDGELTTLAATVAGAMREELAERHQMPHAAAEARENFNLPNRTIAILDGEGRPLSARWRGFRRNRVPALDHRRVMTATVTEANLPWRVRVQREDSPDGPFMVFVAASEAPLLRDQHLLAKTLLVAAPIALVLSAIVSWWAASRALRPVTDMSDQAERITLQSLDTRLSGHDADDEVGQLRRAFNRLLDRVVAGVATQRQFMADASHELRTPVSAARTAAEVTLSQPHRDEDEYRDALSVVATQTRRLGRMVDDMLILARADANGYRVRLHKCYIDDVLEQCADTARVLASAKGIVLDTDIQGDVVMLADETLIRQLVLNLLENAVKHTQEHGRICLSLRVTNGSVAIGVSDTGCGVASADRQRIFERFVRLDAARDAEGGAGLGLPIARWIAESHHGTLTLDDSGPSGSTFVARLPMTLAATAMTAAAARPTWMAYARRVAPSNPTVASDIT